MSQLSNLLSASVEVAPCVPTPKNLPRKDGLGEESSSSLPTSFLPSLLQSLLRNIPLQIPPRVAQMKKGMKMANGTMRARPMPRTHVRTNKYTHVHT